MITAKVGERFSIEVPSNPTTGYLWEADIPAGKARLVDHALPPASKQRIGGGGLERFTFEATAPGEFTIRMINKRPWESAAHKTENYQIVVK